MSNSTKPPVLLPYGILVATALAGVFAIFMGVNNVLPWMGRAEPPIDANDLAQLALTGVRYLQNLATAIFGGAILVLSQGFLGKWAVQDDRKRRVSLAFGFLTLGLSLATGFVNIELLLEAADQQLVDAKMGAMRPLRWAQSAFLLAGTISIGGVLVWDVIAGSEKTEQNRR